MNCEWIFEICDWINISLAQQMYRTIVESQTMLESNVIVHIHQIFRLLFWMFGFLIIFEILQKNGCSSQKLRTIEQKSTRHLRTEPELHKWKFKNKTREIRSWNNKINRIARECGGQFTTCHIKCNAIQLGCKWTTNHSVTHKREKNMANDACTCSFNVQHSVASRRCAVHRLNR